MPFRAPDPPGSLPLAALHLAGLSALAVAQPLFDLLARNAEFFAVRGSSRAEIVLFALGLVAVPPLALTAVEALAGVAHARLATAVHLLAVGTLVGLLALQAVRDLDASTAVALAAAAGAAAAALYARARPARMLLTVLAAAPPVFAALFLLGSPVARLVLARAPEPALAAAAPAAPVVLIVFDELPTISLLDAEENLDRVRYPSFARLAADAVWFRNATTVHEWTTGAVPALLTGRLPRGGELPLYLDHPDNLFTLLGGSHELRVVETQTHLCPGELCAVDRPPVVRRVASLLSDVSVVYGHVAAPEELGPWLPSINSAWEDFGGEEGPVVRLQEGPADPSERFPAYDARHAQVRAFVDRLGGGGARPALSFLHVLLPHHPWEYLPNGKLYAADLGFQPGMVDERWRGDPELAVQAHQRHLLQTGYVDLVLGRILDRLERTGEYDRSLVVVAADHGVSFRPRGERRRVHRGNLAEIAFVPLFVKAPGQTSGRVVDEHVRLTDVLPTIADVLGVDVPWRVDGRSALGPLPPGRDVRVRAASGEVVTADLASALRARRRALERQLELFGAGSGPPGLHGIGPRPELLGRPVDRQLATAPAAGSFESFGDGRYDPAAAVAPVRVYGELDGVRAGADVAFAVNGRIVAVTRSFSHRGRTLVSAVVPEESFRPGANAIRAYLVEGPATRPVLRELPQRAP